MNLKGQRLAYLGNSALDRHRFAFLHR
jgi:hypothetical protein